MAIPIWLTVNPVDVQTDSRVTAYMANTSYDDAAFQAEITRHIVDWSNTIISRLRRHCVEASLTTDFSDALATILSTEQQGIACQALKLFVIASIWQNLSGSDAHFSYEAADSGLRVGQGLRTNVDPRMTSAEGLIGELEKQIVLMGIANVASQDNVDVSLAGTTVTPRRVDEYTLHPLGGRYRYIRNL